MKRSKYVSISLPAFHSMYSSLSMSALSARVSTVPGQITVPAATYTQDSETGEWNIQPGISTLVVTGTV